MNKLIELLGITEIEYNNFLFDSACEYAESYLGTQRAALFIDSPAYWVWYRTQFEAADAEFLAKCLNEHLSRAELIRNWKQLHHIKYMHVYPSSAVIRAAGGVLKGKREVSHG